MAAWNGQSCSQQSCPRRLLDVPRLPRYRRRYRSLRESVRPPQLCSARARDRIVSPIPRPPPGIILLSIRAVDDGMLRSARLFLNHLDHKLGTSASHEQFKTHGSFRSSDQAQIRVTGYTGTQLEQANAAYANVDRTIKDGDTRHVVLVSASLGAQRLGYLEQGEKVVWIGHGRETRWRLG
jgi:hypothetical protein